MEKYVWEGSISQKKMDQILGPSQVQGALMPSVVKYKDAVVSLHNEGGQ